MSSIARTGAGRFAPSPSGDLHVGNLRTAVLAYLYAHITSRRFLLRMEDLDRTASGADMRQLADLETLGIHWERPVIYQSARLPRYREVIAELSDAGRTFTCFCTRREILEAPSAPHSPQGAYPGTCRFLTAAERRERQAAGRQPAIRLIADTDTFTIHDDLHGQYTGMVDHFVLQRNDGVPAYNLAAIVDDADDGIDQVVRGEDLLSSAPRQAYLTTLLNSAPPTYAHVPMALNPQRIRLSKRDGAVTLADLAAQGISSSMVLSRIGSSLNLAARDEPVTLTTLAERFDPAALPREPWIITPDEWL